MKQGQSQNLNQNNSQKKKLSKTQIFSIVTTALIVAAHLSIVIFVIFSYKYYGIYPSLFYSVIGIIVCLIVIVDIIFFIGFNHRDMALKVVCLVLASFLFIGGVAGSCLVAKVNSATKGILSDGSSDNYETYSGVFLCYKGKHDYTSLDELAGKRVGMLAETTNGLSYIAKSILDEKGFDYAAVDTYASNTELMQALINGDVNAIVITSAYEDIYKNDENSNIKDYLEDCQIIYSFEQELKVTSNKKKKDLTKEPFNVLLIGWSRTDIGSTVGLADAIIVATINPQTYTVSMMSIARDSFVPIACYGGSYDKINSGRSTSRACFIETVENFIGMDIDYYMEADYGAIVMIVNSIGGVYIDNPVDFELDGVEVPAGQYIADGWQALEFMRERHHMPNGDFDRQKHQKEVIIEIAKTMIASGDINLALTAMKNASDDLDTNFTLQELSSVFNLLLNTKNYTSLDTFDLVDFQTLRMTGSGGIKYYSYSMRLPLWVYLIYKGSYDESIAHINNVMGNYDSITQNYSFEFSAQDSYVRAAFYSESYPDEFMYQPDPMPAYWANLSGMTYAEAMEWASENGVSLSVEFITINDSNYNAKLDGQVVDQSVRYGALISEYSSGTITVMGTGEIDESKQIPNFVGKNYSKFVDWAKKYDISYDITFDTSASGEAGLVTEQNYKAYSAVEDIDDTFEVIVKADEYDVKFSTSYKSAPSDITIKTGDKTIDFTSSDYTYSEYKDESTGKRYLFKGWYTQANGQGTKIESSTVINSNCTLYAYWVEKQTYTYKFVVDGTEVKSGTVYEGEIPSTPDNPSKTNYIFNGWSPSVGTVTSNVTYTAQWVEEEETVDYDGDLSDCDIDETVTTSDSTQDGVRFSGSIVKGKATGTAKSKCKCKIYKYEDSSGGESGDSGESGESGGDPAGDTSGGETSGNSGDDSTTGGDQTPVDTSGTEENQNN